MNIDKQKETIRNSIKEKLKNLPEDFRNSSDRIILTSLFSIPEVVSAKTISVYSAINAEVGTSEIFRSLWKSGDKSVFAPRIHGNGIDMCQVYSAEDFVDGPHGLKEPTDKTMPYTGVIDVIVVPGRAFDMRGVRLGWGKGYYDRFLKTIHTCTIGLAYDFQLFTHLPENTDDVPMDFVITEKRIVHPGKI